MYEHAKFALRARAAQDPGHHEILAGWRTVAGGEPEVEPPHGSTHLPRKFKVGFAIPPSNDVDVYSFVTSASIGVIEHGEPFVGYTSRSEVDSA